MLWLPFSVLAGAPPTVPVQGLLADASGVPLDGEFQLHFAIYAGDAEPAVWSETQSVTVENGLFVAYLGQVNSLDLSTFRDNDDLSLGISVGQDQEMQRITLGSTPFSGFAEYAGNDTLSGLACQAGQVAQYNGSAWACASPPQPTLPSGTVIFVNLPDCPAGWSELSMAGGRYLVGRPPGGALGATVGTALGDQENRPVGRHGHTATAAPHSHVMPFYDHSHDNYNGEYTENGIDRGDNLQTTNPADVTVTVADTGAVDGTTAPYLQLTVCVKD
jgi:hypothetical protein